MPTPTPPPIVIFPSASHPHQHRWRQFDTARESLGRAIEQNNHAALLIGARRYSEASFFFSSSLTTLKALHSCSQASAALSSSSPMFPFVAPSTTEIRPHEYDERMLDETYPTTTRENLTAPSSLRIVSSSSSSRTRMEEDSRKDYSKSDKEEMHHFFGILEEQRISDLSPSIYAPLEATDSECKLHLYQRPVLIDPMCVASFADTGDGQEVMASILATNTATVIFNLALTIHIASMATSLEDYKYSSTTVTEDLIVAQSLYELAFEIIAQSDTELLLLVVNNLGVLHLQQKRYGSSFKCFKYVLMALMYVVDQRLNFFERENMEFLMQNALLLVGCSYVYSAAPAA
jgi:hypothetical protein